jgi:hypothetical protein
MHRNPGHPMSKLFDKEAVKFIALILWKLRAHCPGLEVRLEAADLRSFNDSFIIQQPVVACIGEQDAIVLRLVDSKTGEKLFMQKGDPNSPEALEMVAMMKAIEDAPKLAERLRALQSACLDFPPSDARLSDPAALDEAINALMLLSGPHPK